MDKDLEKELLSVKDIPNISFKPRLCRILEVDTLPALVTTHVMELLKTDGRSRLDICRTLWYTKYCANRKFDKLDIYGVIRIRNFYKPAKDYFNGLSERLAQERRNAREVAEQEIYRRSHPIYVDRDEMARQHERNIKEHKRNHWKIRASTSTSID